MLRTIAGLLAAIRSPRLWLIVFAFYLGSGFVVSSPFALVFAESVHRMAFHVFGDFTLWRWLSRLHGDTLDIAFGASMFPAVLALIVWQFLVGALVMSLRALHTKAHPPRFIADGARLFFGNVRITILSWLPLVILGMVISEQGDALGLALVDEPNDARSFRLLVNVVVWVTALVVLVSVWSDLAAAYLAADDKPRALRALGRAGGTILRRPISSAAMVVWVVVGTACVSVFSFQTQLSNTAYAPASPTVALVLLSSALLAAVRVGALGAAACLAWPQEDATP